MKPMACSPDPTRSDAEQICLAIGQRAGNLFMTRQLWCSGATLVVLNQALGGDLTEELAIRLAAGLGDGMGGSGCLCGAVSGGALALGLFLGTGRLSPGGDQRVLRATHRLHDRFKTVFGSTCCRVLKKKSMPGCRNQNEECAGRTAKAAELTAELILEQRPACIHQIDWKYLNQRDSMIGGRIKIIANQLL